MTNDELRKQAMANLSVGYNDDIDEDEASKLAQQKRKYYQSIEYNKLKMEAQQAAARGLISQDEVDDWRKGKRSNVLQRVLFDYVPEAVTGQSVNNGSTGSVLETLGDVLSIPNYFMGSLTKATVESGYDVGPFKIGFSTEAFLRNWQMKTDYTSINRQYEVLGEEGSWTNLGAGIMADIAMDPTTYLTLGVSAGSKVKLGVESALAIGQAEVTMSKTGRKMYALAGRELAPKFAMDVKARNALLEANGLPPLRMLDEELAASMHAETIDHMVKNFEPLQKRFAYEALRGRNGVLARTFDAAARVMPGSETNVDALREGGAMALQLAARAFGAQARTRADDILGLKVTDLFNETASAFRKERGLYDVASVQNKLAHAPVIGKAFSWTFDHFDVGWDAEPDVVSAVRKTKVAIETKVGDHTARVAKEFYDATKDEMEAVSRMVEARAYKGPVAEGAEGLEVPLLDQSEEVFDAATNKMVPNPNYLQPQLDNDGLPRMTRLGGPEGPILPEMSPRVQKMVEFFEQEMKDILQTEKDYGFEDIGTIEGYVNHVYRDPKARDLVMEMVVKKLNKDNVKSVNRFAQQRMIATINDVEELFGKGTLELDAFKLLSLRRRASVNLIETDKLLQRVTRDHGVASKLVSDLKKGIPRGMLQSAFMAAGKGVHFVMGADQVYKEAQGRVARLGFRRNDLAHTREMLEYLAMPPTPEGRFSDAGEAMAKRLGLSQDARMYTLQGGAGGAASPIPSQIYYKPAEEGKYLFVQGRMDHSDNKGFSKMKVSDIFKMLEDPTHQAWEAAFGFDQLPQKRGVRGAWDPYKEQYAVSGVNDGSWRERSINKLLREEPKGIHPEKVEDLVRDSKSAKVLAQNISDYTTSPENKLIAKRLAEVLGDDVKVELGMDDSIPSPAWFDVKKNHIYIRELGDAYKSGMSETTVLHELVHAATIYSVNKIRGYTAKDAPGWRHIYELDNIRKDLTDIVDKAPGVIPDKLMSKMQYYTQNTDELLAGVFSDAEFREFLSGVVNPQTDFVTKDKPGVYKQVFIGIKKWWDSFTGSLCDLLGIPRDRSTMLGSLIVHGNAVMGEKIRKADFTDADLAGMKLSRFGAPTGVKEPSFSQLKGLLGSLDKYTKKNFDSQLEGMVPDLLERVQKAFEHHAQRNDFDWYAKWKKNPRTAGLESFADFLGQMSKPMEVRRVEGQLPEVFVNYLQQVRRRFGIVTDLVPATNLQKREIEQLATRLKFSPADLKKVGLHLLGEEDVKTSGHADQMIRLLRGEIPGNGEGKMVELSIDMTPHRDNPYAPTRGDQDILPMADAGPLESSDLGGANEALRDSAIKAEVVPPEVQGFADVPGSMSTIPRRPETVGTRAAEDQIRSLKEVRAEYKAAKDRVEDLKSRREALKNARELRKTDKTKLLGKKNEAQRVERNRLREELTTRSKNTQAEYSAALKDFREKATAYREAKKAGVPEKLEKKTIGQGPGDATTLTPKGGLIEPKMASNRPVTVKIHIDQGTAKLLQDMLAPDIDPHWSALTRQMVMGLDKINGFFKSNLVLPWTGSWARNAVSNTAIAYMKAGITMMHPEMMESYWHGMKYILAKHSDYAEGIGKKVDADRAGNFLFRTRSGLEVPMKELIPEMAARGVFRASISDDVAKAALGGKFAAGISGAAMGATAGALLPRDEEGDNVTSWQNIGSLLGAAAGAYVGARSIRGTSKLNKATRTLQTGFKPMLRAGEMATEIPVRMALFMHEFWKSGSVAEAGNEVYRHLNDWNSLGVFERRYIRRAIPFYNWTKLALRQSFFSIAEEPGRVNNMLKSVRNWNEGQNVDPEDIPDYLHDKLTMAGSFLGKEYFISGAGLPIEDAASIATTVIPGTTDVSKEIGELYKGTVSRGQFLGSSAMEMLANRDSFTGDLIRPDQDNKVFSTQFQQGGEWRAAPAWLQTLVGYTPATQTEKERVNASMAWVMGEVPVSRFINVAKQIYDSKDPQRFNYESLARTVLGASAARRDESGRFFYNQGRIDKMKILLSNVGAIKTYEGFADSDPRKEQRRRSGGSSGGIRKSSSSIR